MQRVRVKQRVNVVLQFQCCISCRLSSSAHSWWVDPTGLINRRQCDWKKKLTTLSTSDAEFVCRCYNGQFWLSDEGFKHIGSPSFGRIHSNLDRIRSECFVTINSILINSEIPLNQSIFCTSRGKINYREMYDALKTIDPPLGFGK